MHAARAQVLEIIGRGGKQPDGHMPFTPRAKTVLELALREARVLGHNYIETEHILLGIVREGDGVASRVLVNLGVDPDRIRTELGAGLSGREPPEPAPRPPMPRAPRHMAQEHRFAVTRALLRQPPQTPTCALCRRDLWEVDRYVEWDGAAVCNWCVEAAAEMLGDDATRDQRAIELLPRAYGRLAFTADECRQIRDAFRAAFFGDMSAVEDGPAFVDVFEEWKATFPGSATYATADRIRRIGENAAEVRFTLRVRPHGIDVISDGQAKRIADRWCVASETFRVVLRPPEIPEFD